MIKIVRLIVKSILLLLCSIIFVIWFSIIEIVYQNSECSLINITKYISNKDVNCSLIDPRLKLNHITILGTHNSYHKSNIFYRYSHKEIDKQLSFGVRQIEIDIHLMKTNLVVYHLQLFDDRTNCYCFKSCLIKIVEWINQNPLHYPIYLFIEIKQMFYEDLITGLITGVKCQHLQQIKNEILEIFSLETFILPNKIKGNKTSISLALKTQRENEFKGDYTYNNFGWPPVYKSLGKIIPVFLDDVHNKAVQLYSTCDPLQNFFLIAQSKINLIYSSIITISNTNNDIQKLIKIQNNGQITRILLSYENNNLNQIYQTNKKYGIHIISTDSEQCNHTLFCQSLRNDFKNSPVLCNHYFAPSFCNLSLSFL